MHERFLALWFPRLGAERWIRLGACGPAQPLVTVSPTGPGRTVECASAAAALAGARPGMGIADAFAVCGHLAVLPKDIVAEAGLLHALARWAQRRRLRADVSAPDGLVIHAGSGHMPERQLATSLLDTSAAAGLTARHGIADTPAAASILSRQDGGPASVAGRIAPPGRTGEALAPLPVAALGLGPAAMRRLDRLGVRRIGEIGDWPDPALRRYLGAEVADRMQEALGRPQATHGAEQGEGVVSFAARQRPQRAWRRA